MAFSEAYISGKSAELHAAKVRKVIETLEPCTPEELGMSSWTKKLNAAFILADATYRNVDSPDKWIGHLLNHKKITVMIHDMILVAVWRDEVLPLLLAANKSRPKPDQGKEPQFCGTTAVTVLKLGYYYSRVLASMITTSSDQKLLELALALVLNTDVSNLVVYSIQSLKNFLANNPYDDPWPDHETVAEVPDNTNPKMSYANMCEMAHINLIILLYLMDCLKVLPNYAVQKLLHPDTSLIETLVEFLDLKPYRHYHKQKCPLSEALEPLVWRVLKTIFAEDTAKVLAANNLNSLHPGFAHLTSFIEGWRDSAVAKEGFSVIHLHSFLAARYSVSASWKDLPPPLPSLYYKEIRAEVQQKMDSIIQFHTHVGTFELTPLCQEKYERMHQAMTCVVNDLNHWCFHCGKTEAPLCCSRCHYAFYCDRKCQRKDWAKHKPCCDPNNVPKEGNKKGFPPPSHCGCQQCERRMELERIKKELLAAAEMDRQKLNTLNTDLDLVKLG